jgi:hypothetical protein
MTADVLEAATKITIHDEVTHNRIKNPEEEKANALRMHPIA